VSRENNILLGVRTDVVLVPKRSCSITSWVSYRKSPPSWERWYSRLRAFDRLSLSRLTHREYVSKKRGTTISPKWRAYGPHRFFEIASNKWNAVSLEGVGSGCKLGGGWSAIRGMTSKLGGGLPKWEDGSRRPKTDERPPAN
jgi:hypothetical protein